MSSSRSSRLSVSSNARAASGPMTGSTHWRYFSISSASLSGLSGSPLRVGQRWARRSPETVSTSTTAPRRCGKGGVRFGVDRHLHPPHDVAQTGIAEPAVAERRAPDAARQQRGSEAVWRAQFRFEDPIAGPGCRSPRSRCDRCRRRYPRHIVRRLSPCSARSCEQGIDRRVGCDRSRRGSSVSSQGWCGRRRDRPPRATSRDSPPIAAPKPCSLRPGCRACR